VPVGSTPYAKNPESAELAEVHKKAMRARLIGETRSVIGGKGLQAASTLRVCSDRACYVHNT
jgi:hypothetical protein